LQQLRPGAPFLRRANPAAFGPGPRATTPRESSRCPDPLLPKSNLADVAAAWKLVAEKS
jgi:hypothetical protein